MAVLGGKLLLMLAIYLARKASAEFKIVAPFPENIYPIEFTSAKVTCVAFDSEDPNVRPRTIKFMRKDAYTIYRELKPNKTLSFTNRTEENGRKLFVTMHLKNVTIADDSVFGELGRYECHAYAVGSNVKHQHGFSVNVIRKSEIPEVSVTKLGTLDHGQDVTLTCNITERESQFPTLLKRISWYKDGAPLQSVRNPDPTVPDDTVGPLVIKNLGVNDGGTYRCLLEVELRNVKPYNVSEETTIYVAPWLNKPKEDLEVKKFKGDKVTFECVAQGFPLAVEWKLKKKNEETIQSCINSSTDSRYQITRSESTRPLFKPYLLTIEDLTYTDRGMYYCCLPTQCSDDVETDCQRFILRIRDPLGPLWPVIGILVEAILLVLIIFLAEKRKQKKERAEREDGRIEFSFSSTDDGDRGQVRMRKIAENPKA